MTIDKDSCFHKSENRDNTEYREVITNKNDHNSTKLLEAPTIANQECNDRHRRFNFLRRGIFWGGIFTLNALISAGLGAALTTFEPINQGVKKVVGKNWTVVLNKKTAELEQIVKASPLTRPINILLVEIQPTKTAPEESPQAFIGHSNSILLLQFKPQQRTAKLVNIPLDSRVRIPGFGWNTIVNANRYGGMPLVSQAVSQMNQGVNIDRYIRATPEDFASITSALGKLEVASDLSPLRQQQASFEAFRQHLNNPDGIADLVKTIKTVKPNIDTNLSLNEAIAVASFLGKLRPKQIRVSEPVNYTQYRRKTVPKGNRISPPENSRYLSFNSATGAIDSAPITLSTINKYSHPFHHVRIAVQNTTNRPELGMRVVSYLMKHNFQNVSLIEHIPLKLENTEIVISSSNLRTGTYLQQVLNLGHLKLTEQDSDRELVIRIGDDAQYLTIENGFLR